MTDSDIILGYSTDHSAIILKYIYIIEDVKKTYATNLNPDENMSTEELQFNINDQLFLETLLMIIRGDTIKYSLIKKKERYKEEQDLELQIKAIEDDINTDFSQINNDQLNTLAQKKERLEEIRMVKVQVVMLRSRVRYEKLGEKPTKYFFNLENRQFTNKVMNKIIEENGDEYINTKDVLNCQKRFYQNLYDELNVKDDVSISDTLGENETKLSDQEAENLEW